MSPFQKRHYYLPAMKGSYSIKAVLPALFPERSYDDLEIQEGGSASQAFFRLFREPAMKNAEKTRQDLLAYCGRDTEAMVWIMERLSAEVL